MKTISIVGYKKSGKTSFALKMLKELKKMGLKVCIIKNTHIKNFDKAKTDTAQFSKISDTVIGFAKNESFIYFNEKTNLEKMLSLVKADIVLIEGMKTRKNFPRILILKKEDKNIKNLLPELAICSYGDRKIKGVRNFKSIKKIAELAYEKAFILPDLNCGNCGKKNCFEMACAIISDKDTIKKCEPLKSSLKIKVNNKTIYSNPFVEKIFQDVIMAILNNLKGVKKKGEVEISFKF